MVTDGVLEYLHVINPEETMREMIESIETNNPGIMSKRIMERVMLFTGGRAKDDMTVLCACLWEKK
jgi:stage II sporulation protein E